MIRIETDGPVGAECDEWRAKAERARAAMIREFLEDGTIPDPDKYQAVWSELKELFLHRLFNEKCAFCEAKLQLANFPAHVEHYRPKKRVTEQREKADHPGYFWLACEWYNLLLICHNCNTAHTDARNGVKHPGKANEFPIDGTRVASPSSDPAAWVAELEDEKPQLLHPYFDYPEEHIAFSDLGVPYPKDDSARGLATIKDYDLWRLTLCEQRREHAQAVARKIFAGGSFDLKMTNLKWCEPSDQFSAWLKRGVQVEVARFLTRLGLWPASSHDPAPARKS